MSQGASPDEEESRYNEGRGLLFSLEFTPVPPPLLPGEKKPRKNARKLPPIKKTFYLHEDLELNYLLHSVIKSLGREEGEDQLTFSWNPRNGTYSSQDLDIDGMTYTVVRSQLKDMSLSNKSDYQILLDEATKKDSTAPLIKIFLSELKNANAGADNDSSEEEDTQRKKKKKKVYEPSPEEIEQTEFILKLQNEWKCEDKKCKRFICFPDRTTGRCVHLTHFHLQTWAAAEQAKHINKDGTPVDLQNPPDDKIFDYIEPDVEDEQLLRTRAQKASTKDSNITINLTLPDTANAGVPAPAPNQLQHIPAQPRRRIPPQLSLATFCQRFNLGAHIQDKLDAYSVTGPQTLRHLSNDNLKEATLNPAEIADVRDAQDRWMAGEAEQ
ncbi:hypothetical protein B0H16DRAFT_1720187 [Mycena metata]|uniref:Uncharacterized protein n=1 Tax=Mycena metata TaxID=1033252 RepID=A0AAD7J9B0_9AGAR|nr:hypothetical protein B0H16DRAFT_1720187 [Mycena metata]